MERSHSSVSSTSSTSLAEESEELCDSRSCVREGRSERERSLAYIDEELVEYDASSSYLEVERVHRGPPVLPTPHEIRNPHCRSPLLPSQGRSRNLPASSTPPHCRSSPPRHARSSTPPHRRSSASPHGRSTSTHGRRGESYLPACPQRPLRHDRAHSPCACSHWQRCRHVNAARAHPPRQRVDPRHPHSPSRYPHEQTAGDGDASYLSVIPHRQRLRSHAVAVSSHLNEDGPGRDSSPSSSYLHVDGVGHDLHESLECGVESVSLSDAYTFPHPESGMATEGSGPHACRASGGRPRHYPRAWPTGRPRGRKRGRKTCCLLSMMATCVALSALASVLGMVGMFFPDEARKLVGLSSRALGQSARAEALTEFCLPCDALPTAPDSRPPSAMSGMEQRLEDGTWHCCVSSLTQLQSLLNLSAERLVQESESRVQRELDNLRQLLARRESVPFAYVIVGRPRKPPPDDKLVPVLLLKEHSLSILSDIAIVVHNKLLIRRKGLYLVTSQVLFESQMPLEERSYLSQTLVHAVVRFNSVSQQRPEKLLSATNTQCWDKGGHPEKHTSLLSGAFLLQKDDELSLEAAPQRFLSNRSSSFLALTRLGDA